MSGDETPNDAGRDPIVIDVLIIGGGVQGLWLLNDLHRVGYSTLLLERAELGGEQTCHSHVYIHEGHLYREAHGDLAERLRDVKRLWTGWLASHAVQRGVEPGCFGFQNPADAAQKTALWTALGLPVEPTPLPAALAGGPIRFTFRTHECCLNGESLVSELQSGVNDCIRLIDQVVSITLQPSGTSRDDEIVEEVSVYSDSGPVSIRPRALVLAAGVRNQALLDLASGGHRAFAGRVRDSQQLRLAHMLIVKGPSKELKALSGIFPDLGGLFIVTRKCEDEIVWLVSDDRSPPLFFNDDWLEHDARSWLPRILLGLRRLAPRQFSDDALKALKWGVYSAPKAEGRAAGALPDQPRIDRFRTSNLWAVWPTKLTLAPDASRRVTTQIGDTLGPPVGTPSSAGLRALRRTPDVAIERWRRTPMMSWEEFRRCFHLKELVAQ